MKTARNVLIIVVIAALIVAVPGGGTGATVAFAAIRIVFYGSLAWVASLMYRERRTQLYGLGDGRRAILYAAAGVGVLTLSATSRLWATSAGSVAWLLLMAAALYAIFAVIWAARRY